MIEKVTAYKSSDGKTFEKIEDVQRHELSCLFTPEDLSGAEVVNRVAFQILEKRDKILDILTTGPRSKPKARSINGGRKIRVPKPSVAAPQ